MRTRTLGLVLILASAGAFASPPAHLGASHPNPTRTIATPAQPVHMQRVEQSSQVVSPQVPAMARCPQKQRAEKNCPEDVTGALKALKP
jgi:hypothetical protein